MKQKVLNKRSMWYGGCKLEGMRARRRTTEMKERRWMNKTGERQERVRIIGLCEHSYLTKTALLPGPFHLLWPGSCSIRGQRGVWGVCFPQSNWHQHRKAKWSLKDTIHCVGSHLKMQSCTGLDAASCLSVGFRGLVRRNGINYLDYQDTAGSWSTQRWGDNELPRQIRSMLWVSGCEILKHEPDFSARFKEPHHQNRVS